MKFGKELKKQKVPEWIDAYIDYNGLKGILRKIRETKQIKPLPILDRTLSGLNGKSSSHHSSVDIEGQATQINALRRDGSRKFFDPKFLKDSEDERAKIELTFFEKLDQELDKVREFYKAKVDEVIAEANELNKQMEALVALRFKAGKRGVEASGSRDERGPEEASSDRDRGSPQVLERVKINSTIQTPISTIKGVFSDSNDNELSVGKDHLRKAEEQLKAAFIEFYHKLHLLKHYSFVNLSAFAKIMKKYDKITSRRASKLYMEVVDNSYLGNSDEIIDLLKRTEATFVKNFTNSNRREGLKSLRPKRRRERHRVTFSSGFFTGFAIALLVAIVLRIESPKVMKKKEGMQYMQSIFPLYSVFLYAILHVLMYGADLYFWRKYRINYPFIFGFKRETELGCHQVFLFSTGLAVLALSGFLANLHLDMNSSTQEFRKVTELVPLGLVTLTLIIIFCPFNVLYRSSRFFFIRSLFRCLLAPLYPVTFPDFFLADQLTSQTQTLRSSVLYICYYGLGEYSRKQNKCHKHGVYNTLFFVIAVIPYWIRLMQCLRRLVDEKDSMHVYNALSYITTITAFLLRTICELRTGTTWMVLALIASAVTTIVSTYWDLIYDWGLLRRHSKNPYLRDKLLVSHRSVYIIAMALDVILRLAWMQVVLAFNLHSVHKLSITTAVNCLEIIRRGIWNFFRLENEHLNNVGKYRAFRSVPLPFRYADDDDDNDNDDKDD